MFQIKGQVAIENNACNEYIVPATQKIVAIKHQILSGTSATVDLKVNTSTTIKASISVTTVVTDITSSITTTDLAAGDRLSLNVVGVSGSPADLLVEILAYESYI